MKKLILGMAVCCGVAGAMDLDERFDALKKDFKNRENLSRVVKLCVQQQGRDAARSVLKMFEGVSDRADDVCWNRIGAMLYAIVYDWNNAGYYGVGECQDYVDGAYAGTFGPFTLSDFKSDPFLSTTYVDGVLSEPDYFSLD